MTSSRPHGQLVADGVPLYIDPVVPGEPSWGKFSVDLVKADSHRNVQTRIYQGDCRVRANDPSMPFCILFPLKERSLLVRNALWLFLGSVVGGISGIPKVSSSYFSPKDQLKFFMRLAHQG